MRDDELSGASRFERKTKKLPSCAHRGDVSFFSLVNVICFVDASFLNKQYTVWGKVIEGMDNVDKITRGEPPKSPDKIISMKVAADIK